MTLEILEQKKALYKGRLNEIMTTSVDTEVDRRLNEMREKIAKEVIADLDKDAEKCKHYLELIDILSAEIESESSAEKVEETVNESPAEEGDNYAI